MAEARPFHHLFTRDQCFWKVRDHWQRAEGYEVDFRNCIVQMLGLRCVLDGIVTILLANEEHQKPTSRAQKIVPFIKRHVTEQEQVSCRTS